MSVVRRKCHSARALPGRGCGFFRRKCRRIPEIIGRAGVVFMVATVLTLVTASAASAVDFFHGNLCCNNRHYGGWNYWYATDTYKNQTGISYLGFNNSSATNYVGFSGTYRYVDRVELGMGGYMRPLVEGATPYSIYFDAYVCTC